MGFLILVLVTVGATALAVGAATGILLILFHLMRAHTFARAAVVKKTDATSFA